jgi:hypothetical protein
LAGTSPAGIEPAWQVSQAVPDGTCAFGPIGEVAGITMMLPMPAKVPAATVGPWHATQVVTPAWFIAEFAKRSPLMTGAAEMLEPGPTWQLSQGALVGMWFEGEVTIEKLAAGIAKPGAVVGPWHCAQFEVVLGAFAWMSTIAGITEKSVLLWQAVHETPLAVGMWFEGFSIPSK